MSLDNLEEARAVSLHHHLTVMSMELFCCTRQKLRPDPEFDSVQAVFVVVTYDSPEIDDSESKNFIVDLHLWTVQ